MSGRLNGKIAIITGGSSGLGAATAGRFVHEGARVVIADFQEEAGRRRAAELGDAARFVRADVTSEDDLAGMIDFAVSEFGGLDILFNNAGAAGNLDPVKSMDAAGWDGTMALLPRAGVLAMKHAYPHLKARGGGSIINTASIAALRPGISNISYSVAKAAVIALTQVAAAEFAPDFIRVNAISPGIIPTQTMGGFFGMTRAKCDELRADIAEIFSTAQPIGRSGVADDIANMALFLASDESAFVTGQQFVADGGMMLMPPSSLELHRPESVLARMFDLAAKHRE